MRYVISTGVLMLALGAGIFLFHGERNVSLRPVPTASATSSISGTPSLSSSPLVSSSASAPALSNGLTLNPPDDIPDQAPLANPPAVMKGMYITGWSAGSVKKMASLRALMERTELNAVVIDVKDYSGYLSYRTAVPEVRAAGAEREIRIARPNAVIKELHDHGIYVIGRVTVFQDPILARAHPEWAMKDKATGKVWTDQKGLAWMDPAAKGVWEYVASIAKDALRRGFDEINFDYVRFASDGNLEKISFPAWDGKTPRSAVIKNFFSYLRESLPGAKISADLFGLATMNHDDLGIGQVIEDAYRYFDYVSPMTYPSHYAPGFLGYKNPARYPYEVMKYSVDAARVRLEALAAQRRLAAASSSETAAIAAAAGSSPRPLSRLRPWVQDFNLGAIYTAPMVRKQIDAIEDSLRIPSSTEMAPEFGGWLLWDPANNYTEGTLKTKMTN